MMAAPEATDTAAEVGAAGLQVAVRTLGGEDALARCWMPVGTTVAELAQQLRRAGGPPEILKLALGGRELAPYERLGDLEACDTQEGLVISLVRRAVDGTVVEWVRGSVAEGMLNFFRRDIGEDGEADAIAYLLQDPACTLRTVNVGDTNITEITPIAEALQVNTSLVELSLYATGVSDIAALVAALRVNRSLRFLNLAETKVEDVSGLADALRANKALEVLDMEGCPLSKESQDELIAAEREKGPPFRLHL